MVKSIEDLKKEIEWTPQTTWKETTYYEKSWYCPYGNTIHGNLQQVIQCNSCCDVSAEKKKELQKYLKEWK